MWVSAVPDANASLHTWAQWYADQGWPIFPCRGKVPLTPHGFHDASSEPWAIDHWWQQWPDANIGSPTGVTWWALDVDPRAGGDDTLFALERQHGALPHTLLSHTGGGGSHYLWLLPASGLINKAPAGAGLDVQGAGSYIILPPSIHPATGTAYAWDLVDGPDDMTPHPAPAWLEALVTTAPATPRTAPSAPVDPHASIPDGQRNNQLAYRAIAMRKAGLSLDSIYAALAVENARCTPPLDDLELRQIAYSKERYAPDPVLLVPPAVAGPAVHGTTHAGSSNGASAAQAGWGTTLPQFKITDLADMLQRHYPVPTWLIKDLIPEGLVFFVGSPKSSKTYLAYSLALSLAYEAQRGGQWLDYYTINNPGPVVYLTVEDDEAESRYRVGELAPWLAQINPERFLFIHGEDLPRFDGGLVDALRTQIMERYHPALVVLDPISYLYAPIKKSADPFSEVKEMLLPLRWLGKNYHCTMLGVDHRRKRSADDVDIFETTYGSQAKIAVADGLFMIVRDDKEITLHARIRKAADQTLTLGLQFTPEGHAQWTWKGAVDGLVGQGQYGNLRQRVLEALSGSPLPLSITDLLAGLNIPDSKQTRNAVYQILYRAQKSYEVQKTTRGQYVWSGGN